MNRLLTFAGTQPVYLGDIDFLQGAAANSLMDIVKVLTNLPSNTQNAILMGCVVTRQDSTYEWTDGVIVLNGEILPIAAGSVTASALSSLYFHIVSELSGERTFKDGVSHKCHDTRSATITTESTDGVGYDSMFRPCEDIVPWFLTKATGTLHRKNGFFLLDFSTITISGQQPSQDLGAIIFDVPATAPVVSRTITKQIPAIADIGETLNQVLPIELSIAIAPNGDGIASIAITVTALETVTDVVSLSLKGVLLPIYNI